MTKRMVFHTGGPFHPSAAQARRMAEFLGGDFEIVTRDGASVFEELDHCDLFVAAGLHWTGMDGLVDRPDCWPGEATPMRYRSPNERQRRAFREFVASGKPLLGFHGGIASYDDWPEYGQLLGVYWDWRVSNHGVLQEWTVTPTGTGHPVIEGVQTFGLRDEVYVNLQMTPGLPYAVHATADCHGMRFPMVVTAEGGRINGAGRMAYLANGHDESTLECTDFRTLIRNTVHWLTVS
ncbi:MAG: ThuA domain-containing protein [Puniceicoccaceae bacterium]|nr:MAG: ThuA domain-containing protein [Puniceicoccaceae bacterium]